MPDDFAAPNFLPADFFNTDVNNRARGAVFTTPGNGVQVGGASGVINNFGDGKKVLGYPAIDARDALKQWVVLRKLAKESK